MYQDITQSLSKVKDYNPPDSRSKITENEITHMYIKTEFVKVKPSI